MLIATIILAFLAIELKNILRAAACLGAMSIIIGILFAILNALYVMVFQLLTYAGTTLVLFIFAIMLTERTAE